MRPWMTGFAGSFDYTTIESEALRNNPLGDPAERPLAVYLPPQARSESSRRFPVIYLLHAMGNELESWWNRSAFRPAVPEMVDGLFAGGVPPAVVVFIDAWTSLGGSQFLNSTAIGRYLDYVCDDVVPFVDARYPTVARPAARGLAGHSSGGYGAMVVPMLRPGIFGAIASHSGDALFEYSYMSDIAAAVRTLRDKYGGSYDEFWTDFRSRPAYTHSADGPLQNVYAMAAAYSAEPDGTVTLPFDIPSGLPRPDVWERWRALDPVYMVPKRIPQLKALRGIYLDAGKRDEHYLDLGTVAFASQLAAAGVEYTLELHDGSHSRIEYRFPSAWRFLAERLSAE